MLYFLQSVASRPGRAQKTKASRPVMQRFKNPFELPGKWYKANLHTHTTTSDGVLSPQDRIEQYRKAGYDVLALTDHVKTNDVRSSSGGRMLVISGMEYHPPCHSEEFSYHMVAIGLPRGFAFGRIKEANACIAKVRKAGGVTIMAHPYWLGHEFSSYKKLRGIDAVEIFNATCDVIGRGHNENEWSYMLDHGRMLPMVGADDCHGTTHDVMECWTWLKMKSLSVAGVLEAIRTGACYASRGPKIHDLRISGGQVHVRCSPVRTIYVMSGPARGCRRQASEGKTVTGFKTPVGGTWKYVRVKIVDTAGREAWSNPITL